MASSLAKIGQSQTAAMLSSTINLSGPERNQITGHTRLPAIESNLSTNAVHPGPRSLHPSLRKPLSRMMSSLNRRRSSQVQQNGGIECVCSGYLQRGGPLPQSHMLAPSVGAGRQFLSQESGFEQLRACTAARLRIAKQKAWGSGRGVRWGGSIQASAAGSSPKEEESEDLGDWPWLQRSREVTHNGAGSQVVNLLRSGVSIHPTAVVHDDAVLAEGVRIGPLCTVGPGAVLGEGCVMHPGSQVAGNTVLGKRNTLHSGAIVGADLPGTTIIGDDNSFGYHSVVGVLCQDLKYKGDDCYLVVGNKNDVREHSSIHRSSRPDLKTILGDNNLIMGSCHVAHDCIIGNHNIIANGTLLAGHIVIQDHVHTGGATAVHQFCHLGSYAFLAGGAMVDRDVPTFTIVHGDRAEMRGLNFEGLRRAGFKTSKVDALRKTYEKLFLSNDPPGLEDRLAIVEANETLASDELARQLILFIKESTSSTSKRRGICKFRHWTDR
ncbi:UDP-N-acetylglucosamine acyltransferase [Klebsormidium nitens]|uniref:UDP-N-acetylglucosamine acyltransferase n=1 Tax=Klebsormidium nitens TaxID=105231 RepID=A0A1Y1I170_KLENI|nr:UDP-N-acetylglucosamine acyltransferase [Klebsormidium nitens]|eukprot:GAQ84213.1 UDP-N-acetylglucosamine acyltransferase [Klebsormidium nitens]